MKKLSVLFVVIVLLISVVACEYSYDWQYNDKKIFTSNSDSFYVKTFIGHVLDDCMDMRFEDFSGIRTRGTYEITAESSAEITINLDKGELKLLLVKDKDYFVIAEGETDCFYSFKDLPEGKYKLKAVAKSASGSVDIYFN